MAAAVETGAAMAISVPLLGIVQLGGARALRESTTMGYWQLQFAESGVYLALATVLSSSRSPPSAGSPSLPRGIP